MVLHVSLLHLLIASEGPAQAAYMFFSRSSKDTDRQINNPYIKNSKTILLSN